MAVVIWAVVPRSRTAHRFTNRSETQTQTQTARVTPEPSAAAPEPTPQSSSQASPAVSPSAAEPSGSPPPARAELALIIDDCGQWPDTERALVALPIPITMSVMPHVRYTSQIAQIAQDAGKGVMLHLPMEPLSHKRSGPGEIETTMTDDQIAAQMKDDIAQVPLAAGVNNHEGSAASADPRVMHVVMQAVKDRGWFFVDSRTNKATVAASIAQEDGVPNASRNVFLDNESNAAYSESMLREAAAVALEKGSAIAIGHPKPTTLEAIRALYPELQAQGIRFVLVSELVK
ncbi:MAG TPA: divergent polysaccharide deacetylase family protein [Candidatus Baltobacteraceae bacterium]|nr:divergent polysaccharide deacetylase family protein [Candidatus Baltobacteraceae bacterium]